MCPLPPQREDKCVLSACVPADVRLSFSRPSLLYIFLPSGVPGMLVLLSLRRVSIFALTKKKLGLTQ
ncbi:unnamed protein product [Musa acuminata var. zebrina]